MVWRPLMMVAALALGVVLARVLDASLERSTEPVRPRATAETSDPPRQAGRTAVSSGDDEEQRHAAAPAGSQAPRQEVKTAEGTVVVSGKYTDGQTPAEHAPQGRSPEAAAATIAHGEIADPVGSVATVAPAEAAGEPAPPTIHPTAVVPHEPIAQTVFTDYKAAMTEAAEDRKMMFIYFHDRRLNPARRAFESRTLADRVIIEKLEPYVLVRLPRDATIVQNGKRIRLLSHPAFAEMQNRQGVAIIDLAHERAEYYGHVVSTFPFSPGKYYSKKALSIILDLPPGTLTQRTMIYAVRIHPEAPASTQGIFHNALADEAKEHADYQASILVQGHHSWESRFHRINAKLPAGVMAQEVVAESWPNEGLVEAAVDCVHSWRQSPGHWGAVRRRHPLFGYDIKRGRNGVWYATGIFGRIFGRNR